MKKVITLLALCVLSISAQEKSKRKVDPYIQRLLDFQKVSSVPQEVSEQYMHELKKMRETDPKTGAAFNWGSSREYVALCDDPRGDILKRYIHQIIIKAYAQRIPPVHIKDAQKLVDADEQILSFVLTGDENNRATRSAHKQWAEQWSEIKKTLCRLSTFSGPEIV